MLLICPESCMMIHSLQVCVPLDVQINQVAVINVADDITIANKTNSAEEASTSGGWNGGIPRGCCGISIV